MSPVFPPPRLSRLRAVFNVTVTGELWRFLLVGTSNLVLTYAVYLLALEVAAPVPSMLVATTVGIVFTAFMNIRVVFQSEIRPFVLSAVVIYYVAYGAASTALLDFFIRYLSVRPSLAPLPVLCIMVPLRFILTRALVLRIGRPRAKPSNDNRD